MLSGQPDSGTARGTPPGAAGGAERRSGNGPMMPRSRGADGPTGDAGPGRVDRRTKDLAKRLQPGRDRGDRPRGPRPRGGRGAGRGGVGAVVNAAASISGRYPNVGPLALAAAGIPLVDDAGADVLDASCEGEVVRVEGDEVLVAGAVVAKGHLQSLQSLEEQYDAAKVTMGDELERFAENTLEYMRRERHVWIESPTLPDLTVDLRGRHVLIVVRGADHRNDLAHLRGYVREMRPVLIGVDGGADALLEFGLKPDIIIGDFDSVSDRALRCGAQLVVHAYPTAAPRARRASRSSGSASSRSRRRARARTSPCCWPTRRGAELIVAVGTTPRWSTSSTRAGPAWPRRSSCA